MRFAVILPTIRESTAAFFGALMGSFTLPVDVFVLRDFMGSDAEGYGQKLNRGLGKLNPAEHDIVITLADDILLGRGWQDVIVRAFEDVPNLGLAGLDVSHTREGVAYMVAGMEGGVLVDSEWVKGTRFRELREGNVGGTFLAVPTRLMIEAGEIPIVEDVKYPFYADAWLNYKIRFMGYRTGYVGMSPPPEMIEYDDPVGYVDGKLADTEKAQPHLVRVMRGTQQ
jgi:hypothetical protein